MASTKLSKIAGGGGSIWPIPPVPSPIVDGVLSGTANVIPHNGSAINQVQFPTAFSTTATGDYVGLLDGATVWTVNATDVNGACTGFFGVISHWYDSVNDRLYIFGKAVAVMYTAYITLETGVVTNVGNDTFTISGSATTSIYNIATKRAAVDSGNFFMIVDDRLMEINETTGAEVTNVSGDNTSGGELVGTYASMDGTITVAYLQYFTTPDTYMLVTRNGISARVGTSYYMPWQINTSGSYFSGWGDKVKLCSTNTGVNRLMIRTWDRTEFDEWLVLFCAYAGI